MDDAIGGASGASAGGPGELDIVDDAAALAAAAADRFCIWLRAAQDDHGEAHVALTGGSSALALCRELRAEARRHSLDWTLLHLWWGDERYVPQDHPESNAGLAIRVLLEPAYDEEVVRSAGLPIPVTNVHPWPVGSAIDRAAGAGGAARAYAALARQALRQASGVEASDGPVPIFDLVLLGVGPDGHILSVFPESPALAPDAPLAMGIPAPRHVGPHLDRVTFTPRILDAAERILVMVPGAAKADIVRRILQGPRDPTHLPAQLAIRPNATWLLDRESALRSS